MFLPAVTDAGCGLRRVYALNGQNVWAGNFESIRAGIWVKNYGCCGMVRRIVMLM